MCSFYPTTGLRAACLITSGVPTVSDSEHKAAIVCASVNVYLSGEEALTNIMQAREDVSPPGLYSKYMSYRQRPEKQLEIAVSVSV